MFHEKYETKSIECKTQPVVLLSVLEIDARIRELSAITRWQIDREGIHGAPKA